MKESKRCEGTLFLGHFFLVIKHSTRCYSTLFLLHSSLGRPQTSLFRKGKQYFCRAKSEETRSYGDMAFVSSFLGVWYEI